MSTAAIVLSRISAVVTAPDAMSSAKIVPSSMCVVLTELAARSFAVIVKSVISLPSIVVPRVEVITLLASMLIPVPAEYSVSLSNKQVQVFVPVS